ncbi:MAG: HNH endonuclease [Patescibacteria group bacterium]|nr:HNH endonuclease [Patescibacteria group bacterium]
MPHTPHLGPCWEWTGGTLGHGYGNLSVKNRNKAAHRLSWEIHFGEIEPGKIILHKCDNPACVNPCHLEAGTSKQNTQDILAKRRFNPIKGEQHWNAKLNPKKVLEIREACARGAAQTEVALKFGISQQTVSKIAGRKRWSSA